MNIKKTIWVIVWTSVIWYLSLHKTEEIIENTKQWFKTTLEKKEFDVEKNSTVWKIIIQKKWNNRENTIKEKQAFEEKQTFFDDESGNNDNDEIEKKCKNLSTEYNINLIAFSSFTNNYLLLLGNKIWELSWDELYEEIDKDFFTFNSWGVIKYIIEMIWEDISSELINFKNKKNFTINDYIYFFDNLKGISRELAMNFFIKSLAWLKDEAIPFVDYLYNKYNISDSFYNEIISGIEKKNYEEDINDDICNNEKINSWDEELLEYCSKKEDYLQNTREDILYSKQQIEELNCDNL